MRKTRTGRPRRPPWPARWRWPGRSSGSRSVRPPAACAPRADEGPNCYSRVVQPRIFGLPRYVNGPDPLLPPIPSPVDASGSLDVERDSDVPISTQIFWQLAYQIDSGRLLPGSRLPPVRELGAALRVNPNTIRAVPPPGG